MLKAVTKLVNVSQITGVLPVVNGGTGVTTSTGTGNTVLSAAPTLSGNVTLSTGNLVVADTKGIDFSATSGAGTSELLADYEEGVFTPVIIGTTTAGTGTYNHQIGVYTKVGRSVNYQIHIDWSAHTGTGNMNISGLPFTSLSLANSYAAAATGFVNNVTLTALNILTLYIGQSSTAIVVMQTPAGGGGSTAVPLDTSAQLILSGTYFV